ncbi:MAG: stage II sporulation protein M [Propionibacterium sp.]|nr:stage II sporulation protein M [Propionibacterium sp.]
MDIDALRASRAGSWTRLHDLARRHRMSGPEIDQLAVLYRQGAADLASVRAQNPDPDLIRVLSRDLAAARARLTGTPGASTASLSRWFRVSLPAALFETRWWIAGVTAVFLLVCSLQAWWLLRDPSLFAALGSPSELEAYAKQDFVAYYSQDTSAEFGASVWFNNAFIALQCVGGGITGVLPVYVLFQNAQSLGVSAAVVIEYAGPGQFFSFILPHGIPELTAIFIAGAAGLRVFWSMLVPGPRTRLQAVASTGRAMVTIALGLVILLFVSGVLEGFVTPSGLPVVVKVSLGALVTAGVWGYILVVGRRVVAAGFTGDLETDAGHVVPVAG